MGYDTRFQGEFILNKPLTPDQIAYLNAFSGTRRMKRDVEILQTLPDPLREAVGLSIGIEGQYYVGNDPDSIIDYNEPPEGQPGLWCQWIPSMDGNKIIFDDDSEKFYKYVEWIEYMIKHFFVFWGYTLNGEVKWQGEYSEDHGIIKITNNIIVIVN